MKTNDSKTLQKYTHTYIVCEFDSNGKPIKLIGSGDTYWVAYNLLTDLNTQKVINVTNPRNKSVVALINQMYGTEYGQWDYTAGHSGFVHIPSLVSVADRLSDMFKQIGFDIPSNTIFSALRKRDMPELVNTLYFDKNANCEDVSNKAFNTMTAHFTNYFIIKA